MPLNGSKAIHPMDALDGPFWFPISCDLAQALGQSGLTTTGGQDGHCQLGLDQGKY